MKGIVSFLERAGLVKIDESPAPEVESSTSNDPLPAAPAAPPAPAASAVRGEGNPPNLDDIYTSEGVGVSIYPAERLLRLIDGLSAMDPGTRLMAIRAMDAADESWTIDDPLADAAAKVEALASYSRRLQSNLQQVEQETQGLLDGVAARQDKVVGDIRKQMAELEALLAREQARAAEETAAQQARLQAVRDQTATELAQLAEVSQRLQGLAAQFGAAATPTQE